MCLPIDLLFFADTCLKIHRHQRYPRIINSSTDVTIDFEILTYFTIFVPVALKLNAPLILDELKQLCFEIFYD